VLAFMTSRVLDPEVALDLMSETFAQALANIGRFRGTTAEEEQAWLFRIARTQLSRYWRSGAVERRAMQRLGIEPPGMTTWEIERIEELAGVAALLSAVPSAMNELPADQREAVELRVVDEMDYDTIAERLAVSQDVVRARVSRGLRALAAKLPAITEEDAA
jgi:RNA polymerase sigma-70 factor (ECF subfamily)